MQCGNAPIRIRLDQIGILRMIIRMNKSGKIGSLCEVPSYKAPKVHGQHGVAIKNEKMLGQGIQPLKNRSGTSQRLLFDVYRHPQIKTRAIACELANLIS